MIPDKKLLGIVVLISIMEDLWYYSDSEELVVFVLDYKVEDCLVPIVGSEKRTSLPIKEGNVADVPIERWESVDRRRYLADRCAHASLTGRIVEVYEKLPTV